MRACVCVEAITHALTEDDESELSSGVMAAFDSFKAQLMEHFYVSNHSWKVHVYTKLGEKSIDTIKWIQFYLQSRYKKTETKSLKSLTDCQKTVSSLLKTVHDQR